MLLNVIKETQVNINDYKEWINESVKIFQIINVSITLLIKSIRKRTTLAHLGNDSDNSDPNSFNVLNTNYLNNLVKQDF